MQLTFVARIITSLAYTRKGWFVWINFRYFEHTKQTLASLYGDPCIAMKSCTLDLAYYIVVDVAVNDGIISLPMYGIASKGCRRQLRFTVGN